MANLFGDFVLKKRLPGWFIHLRPESLWEFLDAAVLGDGGKSVRRRIDYSTSSEALAYQIRLILHNLGFITHLQCSRPKNPRWACRYRLYVSGKQIERLATNLRCSGKSLNLHNAGNGGIQRKSHADEHYIYFRIKNISRIPYTGPIYDLSVQEHASYVVENMIVHNSPPGYIGHRRTKPYFTQETWRNSIPRS